MSSRSTPVNITSERRPSTPSRPRSPTSQGTSLSTVRSSRGTSAILRSARNNGKRVGTSASSLSNVSDQSSQDDIREETMLVIDELKESLRKAETASEEYQRQLGMAQTRLNGVHLEQAKLEDRLHESGETIQALEAEKKEASRRQREMESYNEDDRNALMQEDAKHKAKHEELQATIRRLKDSLAQRETRAHDDGVLSRSSSLRRRSSGGLEGTSFAPASSLQRSDSKNKPILGAHKDRIIESLKLEIADLRSKLVEAENASRGCMHDLEKKISESRMTNARLLEENESFQLLLREKTLNGDFSKAEFMQDEYTKSSGLGSLAEELESTEGESENYRKLETEAKSLKDQNKALTLYIENIIGRLLLHKDFETFFEKTPDLASGRPKTSTPREEKALPPPPPVKDEQETPSILQRARTVVAGGGRRSRPTSQMLQPSAPVQQSDTIPNENVDRASNAPLGRPQPTRIESHRRSQSDMAYAAPLVNQMYRGQLPHGNANPMTPGLSPGIPAPRTSYFNSTAISDSSKSNSRVPSSSRERTENIGSSSNSTFSDRSSDVDPNQPRTNTEAAHGGAVMAQSKLRPLRLVQENSNVEEEARKKANRNSWLPAGWFNRGKDEESPRILSPSIKE